MAGLNPNVEVPQPYGQASDQLSGWSWQAHWQSMWRSLSPMAKWLNSGQILQQNNTVTGKSVVVATNGFALTIPNSPQPIIQYILNPAGVLATGTLTMPASPFDGQIVRISTTQNVTALTLSPSGGQTISNAVASLTAGPGGAVSYAFDAASSNWFPA